MKELIDYIAWLSEGVYSVYTDSLAGWISDYSDQPYFSRAYDRMAHDAALSDYTNIEDWAEARILAAEYYETQDIPPEFADAYYYAAERARASGMIRHRMPFKRPPYQGLTTSGGATKKQLAVRQAFHAAVLNFNTLDTTAKAEIFSIANPLGIWYYNYFLGLSLAMIKRIQTFIDACPTTGYTDVTLDYIVNVSKAMIVIQGYGYNTNDSGVYSVPPTAALIAGGQHFRIAPSLEAAEQFKVISQVIEFY